ncbi:MAG: HEPN domain-containing protein [Dehalococcoidia bacterium]
MTFHWSYRNWTEGQEHQLVADEILHLEEAELTHIADIGNLVFYADKAYAACRILMLSSRELHFEALYCAQQTMEKYMKALLLSAGRKVGKHHCLEQFAGEVKEDHPEFGDGEYVELCRRIEHFEVAGRYPDHNLDRWEYELELLTFLDEFVFHCRELLRIRSMSPNTLADLLAGAPENKVMAAAKVALRERNARLESLL